MSGSDDVDDERFHARRNPEGTARGVWGSTVLVSIVTPSLNGIEYLAESIESVRRQAGPHVEVEHIFVDGGSTDGTPELAAAAGCTVLTREEKNLTYALNKGARHARGTLIGVLGCDDLLLPGALEVVVHRYQQDGRRWLMGGCRWVDAQGRSLGDPTVPPSWLKPSMMASLTWGCVPAVSTFFHTDMLRNLGYFDVGFWYASDHELYTRALAREPFSRIARPLSAQRRHGSNLSMERNAGHTAEMAAITERFAPAQPWKRRLYSVMLRVWLNGTSPTWFLRKRADMYRESRRSKAATKKNR